MEIIKHERNNIYYKCDCGAKGVCSIKPMEQSAALVIAVKCPVCGATDQVVLLQYDSEEVKEKILNNLNDVDLSWTISINEEIEEEK